MNREELAHVFERFYRGHMPLTARSASAWPWQAILRAQHGDIRADSQWQRCFTVCFRHQRHDAFCMTMCYSVTLLSSLLRTMKEKEDDHMEILQVTSE
ncbi:MAG: hypothetical protein ACLVJ6_09735 [Merdibacter sp.]